MTGSDFACNRFPPPFSPAYRAAHAAVDKLLYDSYLAGHGIILPTSSLDGILPAGALHFSRLGLTLKKGKKSGRVTSNYTYSVLGHAVGSLNSDHVIEMAKEKYGEIYLTTLFDLVQMVTDQVASAVESGHSASDVVLWSMDLKGAFSLLWFRPDRVGLLALPMKNDLTFFPIAGNFGLGLFPFAFNIVSRFIEERGRVLLRGSARVYVDDINGCCLRDDLLHDLTIMEKEIVELLLGSDSVANDKTKFGRALDWIGWSFDLDTFRVGVADKNYYKTLHGFLTVVADKPIQVRTLHTLASWASRYSLICPVLTPFSSYLYDAFAGYHNLDAYIPLPHEAYLVVVLWRLFLLMMKVDPLSHTRDLNSFHRSSESLYCIESDGCPDGLGFFLLRKSVDSPSWTRFYAVSIVDCFDLKRDSKYQNAMEFIAILIGIATLVSMGISSTCIDILGDNVSSLSWSSTFRFRSGSSTSSALLFVLLSHRFHLSVGRTNFRPGVDNEADGLSRGRDTPSSLGFYPEDNASYTYDDMPPLLYDLLHLVDPSKPLMTEDTLLATWSRMMEILQSLVPFVPP